MRKLSVQAVNRTLKIWMRSPASGTNPYPYAMLREDIHTPSTHFSPCPRASCTLWKGGGGRPLTPTCSNMEGPAAELFKHYTWGKRPAERSDTFYTAMGMVTGYSAEKEYALLNLRDQQTDIGVKVELEYDSRWEYHPEWSRVPTKAEILAQARALGADFQIVSHSMRRVAGRDLLEFIFTGKEAPEEPDYLEFQAKTVTDANFTVTADAPMISIRLACLWDQREQAMIVWNTVLNSLQHVRAAQR